MISSRDLNLEITAIEKLIAQLDDEHKAAQLKALTLQLKLLSNIRTNMVTIMKHLDVPMRTSRYEEDNDA